MRAKRNDSMRKPAHQSLRLFYSWLLLALFTAPIIIKGVHVCHYNNVVLTDGHTAYTKSTVQEADKCPICHFMFPAFSSAEVVQFCAVAAVVLGILVLLYEGRLSYHASRTVGLRAPPIL